MGGPLNGVTVVAVEQAVSAPVASRHLADLGARVLKIERPGGGDFARDYDDAVNGLGSHFVWLNRSKESIALDFKDSRGREILFRLIAGADVFLENVGTEAAKRAGIHPDQLVREFPDLIACEISGFGEGGAYASKPAYDLTIQAEAGSIAITGQLGALAKPGIAVADIGSGMYAFSSILAALYERHTTGLGRSIKISMFDTVVEWMGYSMYNVSYSGKEQVPYGVGTQAICPYGAFTTACDRQIVLGVQNEREWARFCREVLARPDLIDDESLATNTGRLSHREKVDLICREVLARLTLEEIQQRLDEARIAHGLIRLVSEVLEHPQVLQRDRRRQVGTSVGPIDALLPVPVVAGWEMQMGDVPDLGEHTDRVLSSLGYSAADRRMLRHDNVIGGS